MKIINFLFAFTLVKSRSIFPKPIPTTLGYHSDHPNILIPVPLFPIDITITEDTDIKTSTENFPEPTTTFEFTTAFITEESIENELTTTTSTAAPFYTTLFEELSEPLTATIPPDQNPSISTTVVSSIAEIPQTTSMPLTSQSENGNDEEYGIKTRFVAAWEMAKELGSMVIGGVGGMFRKITSLFN